MPPTSATTSEKSAATATHRLRTVRDGEGEGDLDGVLNGPTAFLSGRVVWMSRREGSLNPTTLHTGVRVEICRRQKLKFVSAGGRWMSSARLRVLSLAVWLSSSRAQRGVPTCAVGLPQQAS